MYSRTPVTRSNSEGTRETVRVSGGLSYRGRLNLQFAMFKAEKKTTTKCIFKEQPQKSHEQGIIPKKNLQIDRSLFAYHELFCVFGDFYASGTQDAKVTKSLLLRYQFRHSYSVLLRSVTVCTVFHPYPRRLEKITVCRGYYKGSTFFSVI